MEPRTRLHLLSLALLFGAALHGAAPAQAKLLLDRKGALALAFPGVAAPERRTAFLTDEQTARAEKLSRSRLESKIWTYYASSTTYAYFETHPVRTMDETIMVVLDPAGKTRFVEILAFAEPDDYIAPKDWLGQFKGRPLDDELALRRGLRNIAGASLTAEAVARAVRRVLAVHEVIHSPAK